MPLRGVVRPKPKLIIVPEALMFRSKLRDLAKRLKARIDDALEAAAGALLPTPEQRPIPVRVRPTRPPVRD